MAHNVMEELVRDTLEIVLKGYNCCKCEKCRKDMMALALNNLPPHYSVTKKGDVISRTAFLLETQGSTDLLARTNESVGTTEISVGIELSQGDLHEPARTN